MRGWRACCVCAVVLACSGARSAAEAKARTAAEQRAREEAIFAQYAVPVTDASSFRHPRVVIDTAAKRRYRTMLRYTGEDAPRFANSLAVGEFGCGTGCFYLGLADVRTGASFLLPGEVAAGVNLRMEYRRNSRVLHIVGHIGNGAPGDQWFVWTGRELRLIRFEFLPENCFEPVEPGPEFWAGSACHFMPQE